MLDTHPRKLLVCGRRIGKTTTICHYLVLSAVAKPGIYWYVSLDLGQIRSCERLLEYILRDVAVYQRQKKTFFLPNGSEIVLKSKRTGQALRGEGLSGICLDEAAQVDEEIWYEALSPALADHRGWAMLCTTPFGVTNWIHQLYKKALSDPLWFTRNLPTWTNLRIPKAFLDRELWMMGQSRFDQEYGGQFVAKAGAIFRKEWFTDILQPKLSEYGYEYTFMGCDSAQGKNIERDYQAIVMLGMSRNHFYCECDLGHRPTTEYLRRIAELAAKYHVSGIYFEANSFQTLYVEQFQSTFALLPPVYPIVQPPKPSKQGRIMRLASMLESRSLTVLDNDSGKLMVEQMMDFPNAKNDDGPDALELCYRGMVDTTLGA